MRKCACGESLTGQRKVCDACQKRHKLERKRELRKAQAASPWLHSIKRISRPKRSMLQEPISDDRQREIDAEVDSAAERRFNLNPLDPRAVPTIRPAIWLWQ